ncbi:MAG: hypothetical protein ACLFNK_02510 [Candidatus Woesearchaeota archaeon]
MFVPEKCSLVLILLFILLSAVVQANTIGDNVILGENLTIEGNSSIEGCTDDDVYINNSFINSSEIECANVSHVVMYDTEIIEPTRDILDAELEFAVISDDMLQSGKMEYGEWVYYGSFNLDNIYAEVPPSPIGSAEIDRDYISGGEQFHVIYSSGELGYDVYVDASPVGGGSNVTLSDDGVGNDEQLDDGVYTSPNITAADDLSSGSINITVYVDDGLGNQWDLEATLTVDETPPDGSIFISELNDDDPADTVDSRMVTLHMTADDDSGIDACRLANEDEDIQDKDFLDCQDTRAWVLSPINGEKTITYQVRDIAGNVAEYNSTVMMDAPVIDGPNVDIPSEYWGKSDYIEFEISHNETVDPGTTYDYVIYEDGKNITNRTYTEVRDVVHDGLDMQPGKNYTIGVRTLSGGISDEGFSPTFQIVTEPPEIISIEESFENNTWFSDPVISLEILADSSNAPIKGFSYKVSEADHEPNDNIDLAGNNRTLYLTGLSPGEYYLNIKAINEGMLSSGTKTYVLKYDNQRPPIPKATDLVPGSGTLNFNWTEVNHSPSGISGYELNIAKDDDFNDIVHTENVTGNSFAYETSEGATYHFRVRALSGAGVYSIFSDQYDEFFDIEPPEILNVKPQGKIVSSSPVLSVETDKSSECSYRSAGEENVSDFEYTGGTYHDTTLSLNNDESYEYIVLCDNELGEVTSTISQFTVDESAEPERIYAGASYDDGIETFSSSELNIDFQLTDGDESLGSVPLSTISVYLDGKNYDDYSINERGNGTYLATFNAPVDEDVYHATVCYEETMCIEDVPIYVNDILLNVSMAEVGEVSVLEKIIYSHDNNSDTAGFASDSDQARFNEKDEGSMQMNSRAGSGSDYVFFVPQDVSDRRLTDADKELQSGDFSVESRQRFSESPDEAVKIMLSAHYDNIVFSGDDITNARRLSLENHGMTRDQKMNISITAE